MSSPGSRPRLHLVVARDENGVIGDGDRMLWSLRDDLAYFKRVTMGSPIIMGRKTWTAIGRPLPGRRNLVLTRQHDLQLKGAEVFHDMKDLLAALSDVADAYVIGGGQIYRLFLPMADTLHITDVAARVDGAVTFPRVALDQWSCVHEEAFPQNDRNQYAFRIGVYERRAGASANT